MKNTKINLLLLIAIFIFQNIYSQNKKIKNYNIEYDYGIGITEINKIIENKEDFYAEILFEYKYSLGNPSLKFIAINVAGDPNGIFVINKPMSLSEIKKNVKELNMDAFSISFPENHIKITKNRIFVSENFNTTMETETIYQIKIKSSKLNSLIIL